SRPRRSVVVQNRPPVTERVDVGSRDDAHEEQIVRGATGLGAPTRAIVVDDGPSRADGKVGREHWYLIDAVERGRRAAGLRNPTRAVVVEDRPGSADDDDGPARGGSRDPVQRA